MLTIKVIEEDGHEFVKSEVRTVSFNPPGIDTDRAASLFVWYKDEPAETFLSGKIFVMNENGKTVADYQLFALPAKDGVGNNKPN